VCDGVQRLVFFRDPTATRFVLFCFVLFCFVLFCFVLFCFVLFQPVDARYGGNVFITNRYGGALGCLFAVALLMPPVFLQCSIDGGATFCDFLVEIDSAPLVASLRTSVFTFSLCLSLCLVGKAGSRHTWFSNDSTSFCVTTRFVCLFVCV
jgi:hypothetical protein